MPVGLSLAVSSPAPAACTGTACSLGLVRYLFLADQPLGVGVGAGTMTRGRWRAVMLSVMSRFPTVDHRSTQQQRQTPRKNGVGATYVSSAICIISPFLYVHVCRQAYSDML